MIAKFSTADDLMAHYATVRARLHGPAPKPVMNTAAIFPPAPVEEEPAPPPPPEPPVVMMPVVPVKPTATREVSCYHPDLLQDLYHLGEHCSCSDPASDPRWVDLHPLPGFKKKEGIHFPLVLLPTL